MVQKSGMWSYTIRTYFERKATASGVVRRASFIWDRFLLVPVIHRNVRRRRVRDVVSGSPSADENSIPFAGTEVGAVRPV